MWFHIFDFDKSAAGDASRRSKKRRPQRRRAARRLGFEPLESRAMLSFLTPVDYYEGQNGNAAVAAGDFANNGIQDLAVAGQGSVGVLMGNGDGTFQTVQSYATPGTVPSIAVGDLTGDVTTDGKPILDIVVGSESATSGSVSVLAGDGSGNFKAPVTFELPNVTPPGSTTSLPQQPESLLLGDMNGDGMLDVVVAASSYSGSSFNYYVDVCLNQGGGNFSVTSTHVVDGGASLSLGDFNGDSSLDVATVGGGASGGVGVFLGNGNGTLGAEKDFATGAYPHSLAAGDIDGDGNLDLVTASGTDVEVLLGKGDGNFQAPHTGYTFGSAGSPGSVVVGDLDGDKTLDLAVSSSSMDGNYESSYVNVLLGQGQGDFLRAQIVSLNQNPFSPSEMSLADFNGDGFADLAVAGRGASLYAPDVKVLMNGADWPTGAHPSSFSVSGFPSTTPAGTPGSVTVKALNGDGTVDTGYTGTVHFYASGGYVYSSAGLDSLPGDYTFTAADKGQHTFSAALKTAGTRSITVVDTTRGYVLGSETGITVTPLAGVSMTVSGIPSTVTAGSGYAFTVAVRDEYGNVATDYAGTVSITSSDPQAVLWNASYTFTAGSPGFANVDAIFKTAGTQSITATSDSFTGTEGGIVVNPDSSRQFILSVPASVTAGVPFDMTVTIEDDFGNLITGYTGTIQFSSSDNRAILPADYTFTASDKGVHTFTGLVLKKTGSQTITLTDKVYTGLTFSTVIDVVSATSGGGGGGGGGSGHGKSGH